MDRIIVRPTRAILNGRSVAVAVCLFAVSLAGAPRAQEEGNRSTSTLIQGTVITADDGKPVARARLTLHKVGELILAQPC